MSPRCPQGVPRIWGAHSSPHLKHPSPGWEQGVPAHPIPHAMGSGCPVGWRVAQPHWSDTGCRVRGSGCWGSVPPLVINPLPISLSMEDHSSPHPPLPGNGLLGDRLLGDRLGTPPHPIPLPQYPSPGPGWEWGGGVCAGKQGWGPPHCPALLCLGGGVPPQCPTPLCCSILGWGEGGTQAWGVPQSPASALGGHHPPNVCWEGGGEWPRSRPPPAFPSCRCCVDCW